MRDEKWHDPDVPAPPGRASLFSPLARALSDAPRTATGAGHVLVTGLAGGFLGFALAELRRAIGRPLVIVVGDAARAALLEDALALHVPPAAALASREPRLYPAYDHVPFQGMSPSRAQVMARTTCLAKLAWGEPPDLLIVPAVALLDRVPPRRALAAARHALAVGRELDRAALVEFLVAGGYHRVAQVEDPGTFAVRGGIIDIFSPYAELPIRVELFGDDIERIRTFDPTSQRGEERACELTRVTLGPVRDILFSDAAIASAKAALAELADERDVPTSRRRSVLADLDRKILGVGFEDLLPAFYAGQSSGGLETLFDAIPDDALWLVERPDHLAELLQTRADDLARRAERALERRGELVYPVERVFLSAAEATDALTARMAAALSPDNVFDPRARATFAYPVRDQRALRTAIEAAIQSAETHALEPLVARIHAWRAADATVIAYAHTLGGLERLRALLAGYDLAPDDLTLAIGTPGEGFDASDPAAGGLVVLDETEILGKPPRPRRRQRKVPADALIASWRDLSPGDLVVHLQHGVGRYVGLQRKVVDGLEADFLELEYADKNKLFVPIDRLHLVSKHQGGDAAPALDKLGGTGWQKTKTRVKKAVRDIADQLVKLYAERAARPGFAFSPPDELYRRFEAAFPFEETPDQEAAIAETLADLLRERPMDRLVCGDVGFGKTEVAMRAAMKVALDGKQVAVLVPTQVLAEQHRLSFQRRFEGFPLTVESLSGMKNAARQKEIAAAVELGNIDVLIGTHRILSKDIRFKDLGLLVIDEEHRFGVAQKEHLKRLRISVDVLTLTATPIPRTLHLSMMGLRDISLMQTPPTDRLPVQTFVAQPSEEVIAEAIRGELARGGQAFFVHHRVSDIAKQAELIGRLVPEARIVVGHGQMPEGELEKIMLRFVAGEANVLVSTTIIESGIDIPNANTMLINRADCFGLAQLYQLRGRVGRSSVRASCFLLVPSPHNLDGDAAERIGAIQRFSELGSGYQIASHDLDIRGTGDLLGADQAGNIDAVGYETYMELLQQAIVDLRAAEVGAPPSTEVDPELRIPIEARIPEAWLPETSLRLRLYRAIAGARTHAELANLMADAVDRFGPAPEAMHNLLAVMAVKLDAKALGLSSVGLTQARLALGVTGAPPLLPPVVMGLIQAHAARGWRLTPEGQILLPMALGPADKAADRLLAVRETLLQIRNFVTTFGRAPSGATGDRHAGPPEPRPSPADRSAHLPRPDRDAVDGVRRQGHPGPDRHERVVKQRRVLDVEPSGRRHKR